MKKIIFSPVFIIMACSVNAQARWVNLDSLYQPLPSSMHVYKSIDSLDDKPNVMYYAIANLKDRNLKFTSDTTSNRRLTPAQFYQKNNEPLLIVNCSFFSFATNQNLNVVIKDGKLVGYNEQTISGHGKDTLTYFHSFFGAIGISKKRNADVAWIYTDSARKYAFASQSPVHFLNDSVKQINLRDIKNKTANIGKKPAHFSKWKMQTAIGGGPVLIQDGEISISNNEERKFAGKAINDRHPRTAIGYTRDHQLIILVSEGRTESAAGMTLPQLAKVLKDLGCVEALNLDGGGSSCMLINGKTTNSPSDKGIQRPVPSVFLIEKK
jgi:exopolysaccharide biosynthesis protein